MKFKLIGDNDITDVKTTFLHNRGIDDINKYCNLDSSCVNDYHNLDNIDKAVQMYIDNCTAGKKIALLVDCDCDGITSAAAIYNYTKQVFPDSQITYLLHSGKQHGLSDDIIVPEDTEFLLIPDASSNDTEQCKALKEKGIDILILDHHEVDRSNPYAVVVNNQNSDKYTNKEFSGVGIVWQFMRAVDEAMWLDSSESADNYLDLVALGNIADVMDIRSYETKYIVNKGLQLIVNSAFESLIDAVGFKVNGNVNVHAIEWNISPLINAVCRVGTMEDKDILFKAFIDDDSEMYKAKKKNSETGKFDTIEEDVYEHACRIAKNCKSRQDSAVRKLMPQVREWIEQHKAYEAPVIFARIPEDTNGSYTGLVAIKIANEYRKPTLVMRKIADGLFGGSGRNFDNSPLDNFKKLLNESGQMTLCQGHDGAFGVQIEGKKVPKCTKYCTEKLKNLDFSMIKVDFDLAFDDVDIGFICEIDRLKDFFGCGLKPPVIHLSNLHLERNQGSIIGKDESTWKFITDDDMAIIKFGNTPDDKVLDFLKDNSAGDELIIDCICSVEFNSYNGILTPQIQIQSYEIQYIGYGV